MTTRQRKLFAIACAATASSYGAIVVLLLSIGVERGNDFAALGVAALIALTATAVILWVLARDYRRRANGQATRVANVQRRLATLTATAASADALELLDARLAEMDATLAVLDSQFTDYALHPPADPHLYELGRRLDLVDVQLAEMVQRPVGEQRIEQLTTRLSDLERTAREPHPGLSDDVHELTESFADIGEHLGLPLNNLVSQRQALNQVRGAVARSSPLDTIRHLRAHPDLVDGLSLTESRQLMKRLRQLGYLSVSAQVMQSIADRFGKPDDVHTAALMASELELYHGRVRPDVSMPALEGASNSSTVMHVVGSALPDRQSGYTLRTQYTVEAQARTGVTPVVVAQAGASGRASERTETYVHSGVRYFSLRGPVRGAVTWNAWVEANVIALAEVVSMVRPAALHVHSDFINAVIAHPVATHYGIPMINETRGFWEESWLSRTAKAEGWGDLGVVEERFGLPDVYRLRLEQEARMRSASSAVVTLAQVMRSHMLDVADRFDLSLPEIAIVPNAVDVDDFPVLEANPALREALGFSSSARVVGYISSIVEYEGIDTLVRAMSDVEVVAAVLRGSDGEDDAPESSHTLAERLGLNHPELDDDALTHYADELSRHVHCMPESPVQLLIVGDGAELPNLRVLSQTLGLTNVTFTGRVPHDQVLEYYGAIDLFVVPRKRAAVTELVTPLKPYEAMSSGRACVFSDVSALAEIANASGAAELFRADDVRHLATTIAALLADPARMAELSNKGAAWTRRERTWDKNASAYVDVYRSLGLDIPHPSHSASSTNPSTDR
ncbi:glycosyltransferase [Phycicoccus sp. BSK3Z-2]|uniref:Glycosyltransferase n=1 Tax=Phycicoccus avicenniae TaxID=2828860 RepID=A0A941HZU1_9MICO|nr:glycosyltransferase family 4 protein [Phycicoccus avicenniae]MBR7742611.1 glycosyltransferase [Phycicoccus avicenniae]